MPDHPNMILDRMTMAHGLEARSPFLDHRLAEFCAAIPPNFKVRGTKRRYIQVELARRYLPQKIVKRKKQGFNSPLAYMLADEFKLLYRVFLKNNSRLTQNGFLRQAAIENLLNEHLSKKADHGHRLWLLCNAEVWYRMYIEGQGKDHIKELIFSHAGSEAGSTNSIN
jgi:asparagine synthase (glutamine-hydrolysing)